MENYSGIIGGCFIVMSIAACIGGLYEVIKSRGEVTFDGLIKALGIASLFLWISICFGLVSWIVSLVYMDGLEFVWWLSEKTHIPFLLLFILPIIVIGIVSSIYSSIKRFKQKRK